VLKAQVSCDERVESLCGPTEELPFEMPAQPSRGTVVTE
jgi:hypothetical protein